MIRIVPAVLLIMLMSGVARDAHAQRKIEERRAAVPAGFIRIFAHDGVVQVRGWDKDSIAVMGTVNESATDRFVVEMTPRGAKLGFWGESAAKLAPSSVTVWVPQRSQVWVKTSGANVDVAGVNGALDLFSVTGNLGVSGTPRSIYAETMGGNVQLTNASTASARLKTASGMIRTNATVTDLTAVTVSGDINASLESFGRARIESVDGQIRYFGALPSLAVMDLINHAGSITLVIPQSTSADFAFNLYEADLVDEFGIKKRWMMANKQKAAREMTFGVGAGPAARVTIRSFKGPVAIRRMPEK
jgi:hypothetical protein